MLPFSMTGMFANWVSQDFLVMMNANVLFAGRLNQWVPVEKSAVEKSAVEANALATV